LAKLLVDSAVRCTNVYIYIYTVLVETSRLKLNASKLMEDHRFQGISLNCTFFMEDGKFSAAQRNPSMVIAVVVCPSIRLSQVNALL